MMPRSSSKNPAVGSVDPAANSDPEGRFPLMFEPTYGSAYDIAGIGIVNFVAMFWNAEQTPERSEEGATAAHLMAAVHRVRENAMMTRDIRGTDRTQRRPEGAKRDVKALRSRLARG